MTLSDTQYDAVVHPDHLALISCPGSGKTRTLVAKLLAAIDENRESTRVVACITYTNAAVYEIESRLSRMRAGTTHACEVETIHSFCLKHIVAPHAWCFQEFSSGFSLLVPENPLFASIVESTVSKFTLGRRAAVEFEQLARGTGVYPDNISKEAAQFYWNELDLRQLMDFSGIIYWAAQLVKKVPYIARGLASRYRWILVDEFQDTSALQVEILREINRVGRTKFFLVGDPAQSIMSVAGARPELLGQFGSEVNARSDIQLLDNYRSSQRIIALADKLHPRERPMVSAGSDRDHPHGRFWFAVPSMLNGVVDVFLPEVRRQRIDLSQVAVLANRWTSLLPLSRGLREHQVPALGPGARPYKRATHIVAPLFEEIAAHAVEPLTASAAQVRREIERLVQSVSKTARIGLGFAGDVAAIRLIRAARDFVDSKVAATQFLERFAARIAEEFVSARFLSVEEAKAIEGSATAMVADIAEHEATHNTRTTTVLDLGLFARGSESVRLLTMHGSKGREFDAVALVDVFDGHVPFFKAKPGDSIEAEGRRLLYVAFTRARKVLMIFTLTNADQKRQPSRFLAEVFPEGPCKDVGPR